MSHEHIAETDRGKWWTGNADTDPLDSLEPTGTMLQSVGFRHLRVVPNPFVGPAALARARRFADVTTAVSSMGTGAVIPDGGGLVAFHERHIPALVRRSTRPIPPATTEGADDE